MSEPLWCAVRQHYCRCQDFGKRCDDDLDRPFDLVAEIRKQLSAPNAALDVQPKEKS